MWNVYFVYIYFLMNKRFIQPVGTLHSRYIKTKKLASMLHTN